MRTDGVKKLVEEVLATLPQPHNEDVIDEVFRAIEGKPEWSLRYENLVRELGKIVVNTWAGWWIANSEGKSGARHIRARSSLIDSYSQLTRPARKAGRNIKEAEALRIMSEHYQANKTGLPRTIVKSRDVILELLMAGFAVEEAFSKAMTHAQHK